MLDFLQEAADNPRRYKVLPKNRLPLRDAIETLQQLRYASSRKH